MDGAGGPSEREQLASIEAFVGDNTVEARTDMIRCGDGRTTPEQSGGAIRAFGEDFGMMLAIKGAMLAQGAQVDDTKLIDSYLAAVKPQRGENPSLYMHTDTHAQAEGGVGCGHAKLSQQDGGDYGVPAAEAASLYRAILERPEANVQVLDGAHQEQAVLLVGGEKNQDGKRFSVNSVGKDGKGSYFVVDTDGIREHLDTVVPGVAAALGVEVTAEQAMETYARQQAASAKPLAFDRGLRAYSVNFDSAGAATVAPLPLPAAA